MTREPALLTPDSEKNWVALRRAVARSAGIFSFHLVICDGPSRNEIVERLRDWSATAGSAAPLFVPFGPEGSEQLQQLLAAIGTRAPLTGLVVADGDTLTAEIDGSRATTEPTPRISINVLRDRLGQLVQGPLVLLVSPHGALSLQNQAPDLFDVRSATYEMHALTTAVATEVMQPAEFEPYPVQPAISAEQLTALEVSDEPPPTTALADEWLKLAETFKSRGQLRDAAHAAEQALRLARQAQPAPYQVALVSALGLLVQVATARGQQAEADQYVRQALEQANQVNRTQLAAALNNLARQLYEANRLAEAEPLFRRALQIDETSYGPDHPEVATDLNNLALLLKATNRLAEAEPLYRRALQIGESSLGPHHPQVAAALNNLASLLQATNRLAEAEPLFRRALQIDETSYGPDHPKVATDLNNLALLLKATNRLAEAEPLLRRALQIGESSLGPHHPQVATALNNLALLLKDTNRLAEAEPLLRRALQIDETSYGQHHPQVATALNNLALLLQDTNRLAEAEPLYRRALEILETSLGPEHPNTVTCRRNLETLRAEEGQRGV